MTNFVCLFEDDKSEKLNPLVYTRPVFELRAGILTIREKYQNMQPALKFIFRTREYLARDYAEKNPNFMINSFPSEAERICFINGRVIPEQIVFDVMLSCDTDTLFYNKNGTILGGNISTDSLPSDFFQGDYPDFNIFTGAENITLDVKLFDYPWDFVNSNGEEIRKDFHLLTGEEPEKISGKIFDGVHIVNPNNIYIAPTAVIKPGAVLDAEYGPIFIDDGAVIYPNAVLEGPCSVGENSKIKIGAKIYENTSIGPVSKVGGEVEESIILGYSNKQHDGFLGHAYLCQWVNLGADTNNSDLKNNYGNVKVIINDTEIDTGSAFVGLIMGDHSKTGINTMFNTGTVVGVGCNIYGGDFPPKYIPSFSWGGSNSINTYEFQKFIETAKTVMKRRDVELTETEIDVLKFIFDKSETERNNWNA